MTARYIFPRTFSCFDRIGLRQLDDIIDWRGTAEDMGYWRGEGVSAWTFCLAWLNALSSRHCTGCTRRLSIARDAASAPASVIAVMMSCATGFVMGGTMAATNGKTIRWHIYMLNEYFENRSMTLFSFILLPNSWSRMKREMPAMK